VPGQRKESKTCVGNDPLQDSWYFCFATCASAANFRCLVNAPTLARPSLAAQIMSFIPFMLSFPGVASTLIHDYQAQMKLVFINGADGADFCIHTKLLPLEISQRMAFSKPRPDMHNMTHSLHDSIPLAVSGLPHLQRMSCISAIRVQGTSPQPASSGYAASFSLKNVGARPLLNPDHNDRLAQTRDRRGLTAVLQLVWRWPRRLSRLLRWRAMPGMWYKKITLAGA